MEFAIGKASLLEVICPDKTFIWLRGIMLFEGE
jgi:hypothetical protein